MGGVRVALLLQTLDGAGILEEQFKVKFKKQGDHPQVDQVGKKSHPDQNFAPAPDFFSYQKGHADKSSYCYRKTK